MSRASRGFRITWRLIKAIAFSVVLAVIAILLWRILSSGTPYDMDVMTPNAKLSEAYIERDGELEIFYQDQKNITTAERNYGYFSVINYYIIPEANQIQVVFRYNNSTIRHLAEDYTMEEVPSRDALLYDLSLYLQTDLTPDNAEDNAGDVEGAVAYTRVFPTEELTTHGQKKLYNYYRYVFNLDEVGVSLSKLIDSGELLAIYADVYYNEDVNYDEPPYGTLCLYDYLAECKSYSLSGRDRRAIENFTGK